MGTLVSWAPPRPGPGGRPRAASPSSAMLYGGRSPAQGAKPMGTLVSWAPPRPGPGGPSPRAASPSFGMLYGGRRSRSMPSARTGSGRSPAQGSTPMGALVSWALTRPEHKRNDAVSHIQTISPITIRIHREIPTAVETYYSRIFIMRTFAVYMVSITFIVGICGC